jgi:GINS complex protein helical bundle domain
LSQYPGSVAEIMEETERAFLLGKGRVRMKSSVENIEAGETTIESLKEGEEVELPRWVTEELVALNLAESTGDSFDTELFRSLSREKLMGPLQLSHLPKDFYMAMRRRMLGLSESVREGKAKRDEYERIRAASYDLVGMRLSKLLSLSSTSAASSSMAEKLTPEESAFFSTSQALAREWKAALLGGT